ncbi:glutathione transferase GstA [Oleisolibacter albus]|uniref:glutathione transferase GstA n=1 Tax=Oleisolibacter albus TaxID=2171757 RepID=UPI000DF4A22F|nr:glutathione transferase GstA [Oleisolibacter albus]
MKLYYSPGACSLASHIALREAGLPVDLVKVDLRNNRACADGADFLAINPKGYIPALVLDDGAVLTEGVAILSYVADRAAAGLLAPVHGGMERYRLLEWLTFIATELHKGFGPLWNPATTEAARAAAVDRLLGRLAYVDGVLKDRPFLTGAGFTIADAYLFTVVGWAGFLKLDIGHLPHLAAFQARVAARPAVQAAMKAEGLLG